MKLTHKEIEELYEKVIDIINNYRSYHVDYCASMTPDWQKDETYLSFEVAAHSDQGEGADWTEYWAINDDGQIFGYETLYGNFEEFKKNW